MQVGSLASAAAELKALNINVTLQALQVDTKADAQELLNGWLATMETSRPPLSEHRSHLPAALHGAESTFMPSVMVSCFLERSDALLLPTDAPCTLPSSGSMVTMS